jgi:hypothetical protein
MSERVVGERRDRASDVVGVMLYSILGWPNPPLAAAPCNARWLLC